MLERKKSSTKESMISVEDGVAEGSSGEDTSESDHELDLEALEDAGDDCDDGDVDFEQSAETADISHGDSSLQSNGPVGRSGRQKTYGSQRSCRGVLKKEG
eukprot:5488583-Amphidinium_carterae.1